MRQGYPNSSGTRMRFDFQFPLDMDRVTSKNTRVGYKDGNVKPVPTPLPCLVITHKGKCKHFPKSNNVTYMSYCGL